jgi:mannosyltransferase
VNHTVCRREAALVAGIVAVAAALRFTALGRQSFWLDEAFTELLVRKDFGAMLSALPDSENTPPLYYILIWAWSQLFGSGEVGLRTLSALVGTATVPVAYRAGRRLVSGPAGLVLAALVAVNPFMVWYAQEARSYALVVFLTALSLYFAAGAVERPDARRLAAWAVAAASAIATHYFAIFLVAGEAVWLLRLAAVRTRVWAALAFVAAVALALVPLAMAQHGNAGASGVGESSLYGRIEGLPKKFLLGEYGGPVRGVGPLCAVLAAAALVLLFTRATPEQQRRIRAPLAVGLGTVLVPLGLALAGVDYFTPRYLSIVWIPLFAVVAAGMTAAGARSVGLSLAVALAVLFAFVTISIPFDAGLQRDDWRDAAESLGQPRGARAILVSPAVGFVPLSIYEPQIAAPPGQRFDIAELDLIVMTREGERVPAASPVPGFRLLAVRKQESHAVARYVATPARKVDLSSLQRVTLTSEATGVVYERPPREPLPQSERGTRTPVR